jgi:hypothetical protein
LSDDVGWRYTERTITKQALYRSFLKNIQNLDMEGTITKQALSRSFLKNV